MYLDDNNDLTLAQKTWGWGERTGLSFKPITLNGSTYGSGTIFTITGSFSTPIYQEDGLTVRRLDNDNISCMSAIRPAIFGLSPEERVSAAEQLQIDHRGSVDYGLIDLTRSTDLTTLATIIDQRVKQLIG